MIAQYFDGTLWTVLEDRGNWVVAQRHGAQKCFPKGALTPVDIPPAEPKARRSRGPKKARRPDPIFDLLLEAPDVQTLHDLLTLAGLPPQPLPENLGMAKMRCGQYLRQFPNFDPTNYLLDQNGARLCR